MDTVANLIFLGCNYNDKKIKAQFDNLKKRIEKDTPLLCVVIDKRGGKSARDLWKDIKNYIEEASACIFDLTGFRPNVVLELGYALSVKEEEQIFITFRKRKSKGKIPKWLLSDISHLQRHEYIQISELEKHIRHQLGLLSYSKKFDGFLKKCKNTNAEEKYQQSGLRIIQKIRDDGPKSETQIKQIIAGTACRYKKIEQLLKSENLIIRPQGRNGKYRIPSINN